jgi:tetratricopeptide (TPR) repeat protein/WD40 repeat protein
MENPYVERLSADDKAAFNAAVRDFESAWHAAGAAGPPDLAARVGKLPAGSALHAALRAELAVIDLDRRRAAGQPADARRYLDGLPGLKGDAAAARYLVVCDYRQRMRRDPRLSPAEHAAAYPEHDGPQLRAALQGVRDTVSLAGAPPGSIRTAPPLPGPPSPLDLPEEGPAVPGYEIEGELGRGGMGVVYRARQLALHRAVALKMIRGGQADREVLARFRTEAEAVARLQHPHIVAVYEVGTAAGALPYMAMEFVAGGSLSGQVDGTPWAARRAAGLVELLAGAVQAAHHAGVVHRDLKPGNVLLAADGAPKVADFGLAKVAEAAARPADLADTPSGQVLGTPSYMAPEQAAGHVKQVGPAADVYALGAILYELLTGRPPFRAETQMETLLLVLGQEPVPPRRLVPGVPCDLETICLKCLEKEPGRRYASAAALAEDLRRFLNGEPIVARPVGAWEKALKWARRRPAAASLLGAVALLVLVSGGAAVALWRQAENTRAARDENVRTALAKDHASADSLVGTLRQLRQAADRPGAQAQVFEVVRQLGELREQAEKDLEAAVGVPGVSAEDERRRWEERAVVLRNATTRWLTEIRLARGRSIPLPEEPDRDDLPAVALRPDLEQVAVVYPGSTTVYLLDAGGQEQGRLRVPATFAARARTTTVETRITPSGRNDNRQSNKPPFRFRYVGKDRLEYQVREDLLVWDLPAGGRRREKRPGREPWVPYGPLLLAGDTHLASRTYPRTGVTLREWLPGARSRVVWQPREQKTTGAAESARDFTVGTEGRGLFIRTDRRLSLVDTAGGFAAHAPLIEAETTAKFALGDLIPCRGGCALVERRSLDKKQDPPRLVFFNAALPEVGTRALHHDDPPRCLDWAADGLLVAGGADHRVHAWRGADRIWASGMPYAELEESQGARTRLPDAAIALKNLGGTADEGQSTRSSSNAWHRMVWMPREPTWEDHVGYSPREPYPAWRFAAGGGQDLVVARRELLADGGSRLLTELYDPQTGRREHAFPAEGNGRILKASEDHRFAVVVADEKERRGTLEVWSVADRRRLGWLGRYTLPVALPLFEQILPLRITFDSAFGKDWLLLSKPLAAKTGAQLEIWRLPEVRRVGTLLLPTFHIRPFPTNQPHRVLIFGGSRYFHPGFACVIDLETARKVCDLQGYGDTSRGVNAVFTGSRFISPWYQAFKIDPFVITAWDLMTGRRTDLGRKPWINGNPPALHLSPAGDRLLVCGNRNETGMAHLELWDLERMTLLKEASFTTKKKPWVFDFQEGYCGFGIPDYPEKGKTERLYWRWADGEQSAKRPPRGTSLVFWKRSLLFRWEWLLWRDGRGLALQKGGVAGRVRLEDTAGGKVDSIEFPAAGGRALAIEGKGGGVWDGVTGRRLAGFPAGHRFRCFDPTERWALTVDPAGKTLHLWDLQTGKCVCRCAPRRGRDPGFDPAEAPVRLHPGGTRLAVLSQGLLRLWDLEANRPVAALPKPGHFSPIACVAQHAGAGLDASAGAEGVVHLWKRADGAPAGTFFAHATAVSALAFSPDGAFVASASDAGAVALHDQRGREIWAAAVPKPKTPIAQLTFLPGGTLLAVSRDGRALVLDGQTGKVRRERNIDPGGLQAVAVSPEGVVALGGPGGQVHLWDARPGEPLRSWDTFGPVNALAFVGPDLLATGGPALRLWETGAGREVWSPEVAGGAVRALRLNEATGELAVVNDADRVVVLHLPDLNRRLEAFHLGIPTFPRDRWQPRAPARPPAGPPRTWHEWYRWAGLFRKERKMAEAVWACSHAIQRKPAEWKLWKLRAEVNAEIKSPDDYLTAAAADYTQALERKGADRDLFRGRAAAQAGLSRWRQAEEDYTRAIDLGEAGAEVYYQRGRARYRRQRYDLALADLDEALRLDPKHVQAHCVRAAALSARGEHDRALADIETAFRHDPHSAMAYTVRGAIRSQQRDFAAALADLDEALRIDPDSFFAYNQRGRVRIFLGQYDKALEDLNDAIALETRFADAYLMRGEVHMTRRDYGRAAADFSDAVRLLPDLPYSYRRRGLARRLLDEYDLAADDFTTAMRLDPGKAADHMDRGFVYQLRKDYPRAVANFTRAIELEPKNANAINSRGVTQMRWGKYDEALADFAEATRLNPKLVYPHHNRGEIARTRNDFAGAVAEYTRAIAVKPDYWDSWLGRGHAQAELGRWDRAAADFKQLVERVPQFTNGPIIHAEALLGAGDVAGYRQACARLLEHHRGTNSPRTASYVTWLVVHVPEGVADPAGPVRLVNRAVAAGPENYAYAYTLGAALYRAGRFADAARQLTAADKMRKQGGSGHCWLFLAMAHHRLGNAAESKKWLAKAVTWIDVDTRSDRSWENKVQLHTLRREAEGMIAPKAKKTAAGP